MTTKEKLLLQVYQIRNEINTLKGEPTVDLDDFCKSNRFYYMSREYSVSELQSRIEMYKQELKNLEIKIEAERFYSTEVGKKLKAKIENELESYREDWESTEAQVRCFIEERLKEHVGEHWFVARISDSFLSIGVMDSENGRAVFGQTIDIYHGSYGFYKDRFEISIGTCGSFNPFEQNTWDRAKFYIDFGKLMSNIDLLEQIKLQLFSYSEYVRGIRHNMDKLEKQLNNPLE